jgi:hypothetical protein
MSERGGKQGVLEKVIKLLALAASPNEHEARTAAVMAAKLIRQHKLVLSLPPTTPRPAKGTSPYPGPRGSPSPAGPRSSPTPGGRKKSSRRGVKQVADPPERITSPLGGDCVRCGEHYRAGSTVYWFASGGGMHVRCFQEWLRER